MSQPQAWTRDYLDVIYGGPTELWGEQWTAADINDPGFGAALSATYEFMAGNDWAKVDTVSITVDYLATCPP